MTTTITKNAYRMLVLAVMALLMAVNLSQVAFACLTSGTNQETTQNQPEITTNPMECAVHSADGDERHHHLTNICDERLTVEIFRVPDDYGGDDDDVDYYHFQIYLSVEETAYIASNRSAIRWAACFEGERVEGFDGFNDTEYDCVAE